LPTDVIELRWQIVEPRKARELSVWSLILSAMEPGMWVDRLAETAVAITGAMLRESGFVQPPTVHLLIEGLNTPYVGFLTCREFYRGRDAAVAVAAMGLMGSMLGASRLVVTWENADLCTALELPGDDGFAPGIVVVDADRRSHVLQWHPMRLHIGPPRPDQPPSVVAEWGPTSRQRAAELPGPVADLLAIWREPREWPGTELVGMYARMEVGGYSMRWVQRPVEERNRPPWMELLAPVM
jgi:hypothetical protein